MWKVMHHCCGLWSGAVEEICEKRCYGGDTFLLLFSSVLLFEGPLLLSPNTSCAVCILLVTCIQSAHVLRKAIIVILCCAVQSTRSVNGL